MAVDIGGKIRQEPPGGGDIGSDIDSYSPGGGGSRQAQDQAERGGTGGRRTPLGVHAGYTTIAPRSPESFRGMSPRGVEGWVSQGAGPGTLHEQGPRYWSDDEWRPASQGRDAIIAKQQALLLAGYLSPTEKFVMGRWDPPTVDAYRTLLEEANAAGLTAEQMLRQAAEGIQVGGGGGSAGGGAGGGHWEIDPESGQPVWVADTFVPPPLQLRTTNKDDLRRVFRAAVINSLGAGWSQAEIDELVDAYNWKEIQLQMEARDQEVERMRQEFMGEPITQEAITTIEAPSPEAFAEEEMRRRDPQGFQAGQIGEEFAPAFFQALGGLV